jgi:hypothetical protein
MHLFYLLDPDEWEFVATSRPCTACGGDLGPCSGMCNGTLGSGQRRRAAKEVAAIKAKRQREHEEAVLAEADVIKARRASGAESA